MHVHDDRRLDRIGMPEAVLCSAKSDSQLRVIVDELASTGHPTLLTRLPAERLGCLSRGRCEVALFNQPADLLEGVVNAPGRLLVTIPSEFFTRGFQ